MWFYPYVPGFSFPTTVFSHDPLLIICLLSLGDICPEGAFCPEGSASPTLCDPGYYLNSTRNNHISDCRVCTSGWYCAGYGNPTPTALCSEGYYCPGGQEEATPAEYNCTLGELDCIKEIEGRDKFEHWDMHIWISLCHLLYVTLSKLLLHKNWVTTLKTIFHQFNILFCWINHPQQCQSVITNCQAWTSRHV